MVPSQKSPAPAARTTPPETALHPTPSAKPPAATAPQPSEAEIREYANHLFVQRGALDGYHCEDWQEAEACLRANIPKEFSRTRLHHLAQLTERAVLPLVKHGKS